MSRHSIIIAVLLTILLALPGCEDRGTNIIQNDIDILNNAGISPRMDHVFQPELTLQIRNPYELLLGSAYLPEQSIETPTRPVPLLILLAPQGGDKFYYFTAGLEQLLKEMTLSGEIEPMAVYCMSNDLTFGGYFYANSDPAGDYDNIIGNELITYLKRTIRNIYDDSTKLGIGGVGQGAYGAFRAALKHPGVFTSISVADGPLDFDGPNGSSGFLDLFQDAINEQITYYDSRPGRDTLPLWSYHRDFDSSSALPISRMFIGGALAFSPNDTLVDYTRYIDSVRVRPPAPEEPYWEKYAALADTNFHKISLDSTDTTHPTFIWHIINPEFSDRSRNLDFDFHLPFDSNGVAYGPVWSRWLNNNLEILHYEAGIRPLKDVNIWIGSSPDTPWGFYEQTQSWIQFLKDRNYSVMEYDYSSFGNNVYSRDEYTYDLLKKMLIFHSRNFNQ